MGFPPASVFWGGTLTFSFFFLVIAAREGQASKRTVRAHGAYAAEPATRRAVCTLPRTRAVADQTPAREDPTAGSVPQGGAIRDRDTASQWRVQRHVGAHAEFQGRWRMSLCCL